MCNCVANFVVVGYYIVYRTLFVLRFAFVQFGVQLPLGRVSMMTQQAVDRSSLLPCRSRTETACVYYECQQTRLGSSSTPNCLSHHCCLLGGILCCVLIKYLPALVNVKETGEEGCYGHQESDQGLSKF